MEHETVGADLLHVRATVNLSGLPVGATALVNPDIAYIAGLLEHEYLVPEPEPDRK